MRGHPRSFVISHAMLAPRSVMVFIPSSSWPISPGLPRSLDAGAETMRIHRVGIPGPEDGRALQQGDGQVVPLLRGRWRHPLSTSVGAQKLYVAFDNGECIRVLASETNPVAWAPM